MAPQRQQILNDVVGRLLSERMTEESQSSSGPLPINEQIARGWRASATLAPRSQADSNLIGPSQMARPSLTPRSNRDPNGEPKVKKPRLTNENEKERLLSKYGPPKASFDDLAGISDVVEKLIYNVAEPLQLSKRLEHRFIHVPRGVLLHGPPGCGKTSVVSALAARLDVSFISVSAPSIVAGMSGESEKKIRQLFEDASRVAPCILFFDEIDVVMGKRDTAQREMEKRMVAQMGTCMDQIASLPPDKIVMVFAATNRPEQIDESLRRGGRLEMEIMMGMPSQHAREKILHSLCKDMPIAPDVDFSLLAKRTPGFVGADLKAMVGCATQVCLRRFVNEAIRIARPQFPQRPRRLYDCDDELQLLQLFHNAGSDQAGLVEQMQDIHDSMTTSDFLDAISQVKPMAKREGFSTIPDTTWAQIGAMHEVRKRMHRAITGPITNPQRYQELGITSPSGVLLWGPPGCGKTLVAKAVANEAKANFISIKGPELLNKYVGESERSVRQLFTRARQSQPCVLFFDELDSLVPSRVDNMDSSHRVVNAMLTELDGVEARDGVYVVAATNRPDRIDQAILRPGRLGTLIFVDVPNADERGEILAAILKSKMKTKVTDQILADACVIAKSARTDGFSGADLENLHIEAANQCLDRREHDPCVELCLEDWEAALKYVRRSVENPEFFREHMQNVLRN